MLLAWISFYVRYHCLHCLSSITECGLFFSYLDRAVIGPTVSNRNGSGPSGRIRSSGDRKKSSVWTESESCWPASRRRTTLKRGETWDRCRSSYGKHTGRQSGSRWECSVTPTTQTGSTVKNWFKVKEFCHRPVNKFYWTCIKKRSSLRALKLNSNLFCSQILIFWW